MKSQTPLIDAVPLEVTAARAALQAELDKREQLVRQQGEWRIREPDLARAAEVAAKALEDGEIDLALATDETAKHLTVARNKAKDAFEKSATDLETIRRRGRGIIARIAEADLAIEGAEAKWSEVAGPFRAELRARYRKYLLAALQEAGRALSLGWMLEATLCKVGLSSVLREVKIADPVPGATLGLAFLVNGHHAWLDDEDRGPRDLREYSADSEIAALGVLLTPFGRTEKAAHARVGAIRRARIGRTAEAAASRPSAPAAVQPPPGAALESRAERIARLSPYPPLGPLPTFSRYPAAGGRG
jgi:hypothetical protein